MTGIRGTGGDPPDGPSRRRVLAGVGAGGLVATAGCAGLLSNGESGDGPPDRVPGKSDLLADVDPSVLDGGDAEEPLRDALEEGQLVGVDADAELSVLETGLGLDAAAAADVVLFGSFPDDDAADVETVDAVVDADLSTEAAVESLEEVAGVAYDSSDGPGGATVYEPAASATVDVDGASVEAPTLGATGDGRFAVGTRAGIESALEVDAGDADGVGGAVATVYDHASGPAVVVAYDPAGEVLPSYLLALVEDELPDGFSLDVLDAVEAVARTVDVDGETAEATLAFAVASEDDAQELSDLATSLVALVAENEVVPDSYRELLASVEVAREGTVVEAALTGSVEEAAAILERL